MRTFGTTVPGNRAARLALLGALTVAATAWAVGPLPADDAIPAGDHARIGIDVSHYSGSVAWEQVAASHAFAYVKATEGVDAADPLFASHWQELGRLGMPRGAYHFYVTEDDPEEQAAFFLAIATPQPGDLLPAVDVETLGHGTKPGLAGRLQRFLDVVQQAIGARPMIYTSPNFWNAHLTPEFGRYPLWVAEYGVAEPALPGGWSEHVLWQWKGDARVPGVEKSADLSRLHPEAELASLRIPGP